MRRWLLAILLLPLAITAQEVVWSVDASILLNNREGGKTWSLDQTFMFTRLSPEVGISMLGGEHVLRGGVAWYQPMIDNLAGYKVLPTLYYQYHRQDGWHITLGLLPRSVLVHRMPRYMWSDSLNYCQPNIRGCVLQWIKHQGYAELAIDWRQLQTDRQREAFTAFMNLDWQVAGPLSLGGHIQYNHLAKSKQRSNQIMYDDCVLNPMVAANLSHCTTRLDSLRVAAGAIIALEQYRVNNQWSCSAGFVMSAIACWRCLQVDETLYAGNNLMPYYDQVGSQLYLGDPYYQSRFYSRTDFTVHVIHNRFVDLTGGVMFHAAKGEFGFWQQIACRFYIDQSMWKRRHDRQYMKDQHLKSIY